MNKKDITEEILNIIEIINGLETVVVRENFDNFKTVYKDIEIAKKLELKKEVLIKNYIELIENDIDNIDKVIGKDVIKETKVIDIIMDNLDTEKIKEDSIYYFRYKDQDIAKILRLKKEALVKAYAELI